MLKPQASASLTAFVALSTLSASSFAFDFSHAHTVAQLGGFVSAHNAQQFGGIQGAIGDVYTVNHHHRSNGLVGLGYYLDAPDRGYVSYSLWH